VWYENEHREIMASDPTVVSKETPAAAYKRGLANGLNGKNITEV